MKHLNVIVSICLSLFTVSSFGQITSPTADYTQPTQYTNGMPNDEIFVFCSPDVNGNVITGSLTATPTIAGPGFTFEWGSYDETTHIYTTFQTDNGPTSTINNLTSGGYNVTITNNAGQTETFITWVYISTVEAQIDLALDPVNPGCEPFDVNGTISATDFTYWDPLEPGQEPFIIDQNTTIEVCFSANHTWVSDLGFVLVGPPSCGSPGVTLAPNPQVVNNANGCCCNSGNNLNNLCFSTANANQLNVCNSGTPLSGTYAFYNGNFPGTGGANYPQGGVSALYGCNAAEGGWAVQIYDCIGADVGALTSASITFSNGTSTIEYDSGNINSAINDNSCDPGSASIYVVPLTTPITPDPNQVPNQGTLTYQLGLNGNPISLAPGTNSFTETIDPIPTYDEWYYLTIEDELGCAEVDSAMFDFTGYADATIDDINPTNQLCTGSGSVQLTAATTGGNWTGPGVSATGMFDPMAAGVGTHTITYTIPDPCGDVGTIDITVGDLIATTASTAAICTSNNGTASITPTSGIAPFTYTWNTTPVQTAQTAVDLVAGDYDVTVSDADGCQLQQTITVPFDPSNLTGTSSATPAVCTAENGTATLTPVGGTAPYTHSWNTAPVQNTETAIDLAAGDYDVTLTDANGCEYQETITVPFDPSDLIVSIASSQYVQCFGACDGEATALASGGTAPYIYAWDDPNTQTTEQATSLCPGTYNVGVADANGCLATAQVIITEPTELTVAAVMDVESNCGNPDGEATATATGGTAAVGYTYSWNSTPIQNSATATGLAPASYTVTATDDNGCSATGTVDITTTQGFTASISASTDASCNGICDGEATITTTQGSTGVLTYDWNTTPPQILPTATGLCAGNYEVTVTDGVGCTTTANVTIAEPTAVNVTVAASETLICIGESADLSGTADGGNGPYTYTWTANPVDPTLNASAQNPTVMPVVTTEYTLIATDAAGCVSAPKYVTVEVNPPLSLNFVRPTQSPSGDTAICRYESATIDLQASGGNGQYTYFLDPDNQNPVPLPMVVNPNTTTSYTFTVVDGCTTPPVSLTNTITVNQLPVVDFSGDDLSGCDQHTVSFTDATTPTPISWSWNFGDENSNANSSSAQSPTHVFSGPGLYTVNLEVASPQGCSNDTVREDYIEVFPIPIATFELSPEVTNVLNATVEFTDLSAPDIANWNWNFGDGGLSNLQNPIHTYTDTGVFTIWLQVETIHGCTNDATRRVEVEPDFMFYIPNAFTPNEDGKNDVFRPYGEGVKWETFEMSIYNRWGEEIYYTADIESPWRGWFKDRPVEVGTYVYKIRIFDQNGEEHVYRDGVTLVR